MQSNIILLDFYRAMHFSANSKYDTIRYDTIEKFNVDSKAEYTA